MNEAFFKRIIYSSSNEDGRSERWVLRTCKDILCITGSGARPLDLLSDDVRRIVSLDANLTQNYLLELKLAAIRNLSHSEFLGFIGVLKTSQRISVYRKFSHQLGFNAKSFWDNNHKMIQNGIVYCGVWESIFRRFAIAAIFRKRKLIALLALNNIDEQKIFWKKEWKGLVWSGLLRVFSFRWIWKHILKEPGIYLIPEQFNIYEYIANRFDNAAENILFADSAFAWQIFTGEYNYQRCLPWHLQEENYPIVKRNISKIEIASESLLDHFERGPCDYDGASLSDFSSYSSDLEYEQTWKAISLAVKSPSIFCERHFLVKRNPLPFISSNAMRDIETERSLEKSDTSFIYSFCIVNMK